MGSALVLIYFGKPLIELTIKKNFIIFQAVDLDCFSWFAPILFVQHQSKIYVKTKSSVSTRVKK